MLQDALCRKATLFITTGAEKHLYVVINDPAYSERKGGDTVLVVNFSTYLGGLQDGTCLIDKGEHPFVKQSTYVRYEDAQLLLVEKVGKLIDAGFITAGHAVSDDLYQRILAGFRNSKRVERKVLDFLNSIGL